MLRVDHPDILAFVDYKSDLSKVTNYNLSVSMTDEFIKWGMQIISWQEVEPNQ